MASFVVSEFTDKTVDNAVMAWLLALSKDSGFNSLNLDEQERYALGWLKKMEFRFTKKQVLGAERSIRAFIANL